MKNYKTVNESIENRTPSMSFEDNTYYNMDLFYKFCETCDYKHLVIFGYYKAVYNWTDAEAQEMYNKAPDGWTDGKGVVRMYDWGKGDNKVEAGVDAEWHEPQLDHIVPREECVRQGWSEARMNHPSNLQVLPRIVNRIKNSLTQEGALAILPVLASLYGLTISSQMADWLGIKEVDISHT